MEKAAKVEMTGMTTTIAIMALMNGDSTDWKREHAAAAGESDQS